MSVVIGAILGLIAGYFRGYVDALMMRCCDVMLAFPSYVVTLALITVFGMGENIILAFILTLGMVLSYYSYERNAIY